VIATRQGYELTKEQPMQLRELFEAHATFVCRSLRRLGIPEADLDDMLQEVFLVVCQRLTEYVERGLARPWLYSICRRIALAQRRKLYRRREDVSAEPVEAYTAASQLQSVEDREALRLGQHLLSLLPGEQREVFVLYEVEDMTMQEISEALGCPLQTAYSRLYKARQRVLSAVERTRAKSEQP
jgi:RNA polymerase sigma-70 factor, ECF subfamily